MSEVPGGDVVVRNAGSGAIRLRFTPGEWQAFIGGARKGEFDDYGRPRVLVDEEGPDAVVVSSSARPQQGARMDRAKFADLLAEVLAPGFRFTGPVKLSDDEGEVTFTEAEFRAFIKRAYAGEFDHITR